jgi:hypothetical protein
MDASEFWCRAFLAAMKDWTDAPTACAGAADAALAVAQRRGMVASGAEPRHEPTLERVEFTAERDGREPGLWSIHSAAFGSALVQDDRETWTIDGGMNIRIKWGETAPQTPIEVWIEKAGA